VTRKRLLGSDRSGYACPLAPTGWLRRMIRRAGVASAMKITPIGSCGDGHLHDAGLRFGRSHCGRWRLGQRGELPRRTNQDPSGIHGGLCELVPAGTRDQLRQEARRFVVLRPDSRMSLRAGDRRSRRRARSERGRCAPRTGARRRRRSRAGRRARRRPNLATWSS
jgi:hypothetical protein